MGPRGGGAETPLVVQRSENFGRNEKFSAQKLVEIQVFRVVLIDPLSYLVYAIQKKHQKLNFFLEKEFTI